MPEPLARAQGAAQPSLKPAPVLAARGLTVRAGRRTVLAEVGLDVEPGEVLCVIGPSGAGKTTLLRCFNRLVDLSPGLRVEGQVFFRGAPLFAPRLDVDRLRARVGMLFQQPVVFPGSIGDNVLFGVRRLGELPRRRWGERREEALRRVALWPEVHHRLGEPAATLSVGQQQRLCLARALALEPEVLLMDEPTSALDPRSTRSIEALIGELRGRHTLVVVTHDVEQARRIADRVACLCLEEGGGRLMECVAPDADFHHIACWEAERQLEEETP